MSSGASCARRGPVETRQPASFNDAIDDLHGNVVVVLLHLGQATLRFSPLTLYPDGGFPCALVQPTLFGMVDLAAPDWPNMEHRAIGLHFKRFPECDHVWHAEQQLWYPLDQLKTHVLIYDDRVRGWFLECGRRLPHDGFIVLMIAVAFFEGNEQYRRGESSDPRRSKEFFVDAFLRTFPSLRGSRAAATVYSEVRCGLFHDGMTRSNTRISNEFPDPIAWRDEMVLISPNRLLDVVVDEHEKYVAALLDPGNADQRGKFRTLWEQRWPKVYVP